MLFKCMIPVCQLAGDLVLTCCVESVSLDSISVAKICMK